MLGHRWRFRTRVGSFYVVRGADGRFAAMFEDENLGSYHSPSAAADDLAGGHTTSLSNGVDTATLGIPDSVNEWEKVR